MGAVATKAFCGCKTIECFICEKLREDFAEAGSTLTGPVVEGLIRTEAGELVEVNAMDRGGKMDVDDGEEVPGTVGDGPWVRIKTVLLSTAEVRRL